MNRPVLGASALEWRRPVGFVALAVLVVIGLMAATGMGPEPLLVAAFGTFLGVSAWCWISLSHTTQGATQAPRAVAVPLVVGADQRVRSLRTSILFGRNLGGHSTQLHRTLIELIEDQLLQVHGVDFASDPDRAASIAGPALTDFVHDPDAATRVADTKQLARIVTLIEQI